MIAESDIDIAKEICSIINNVRLSPIYYFPDDYYISKKLISFRDQYKNGILNKDIGSLLTSSAESYTYFKDIVKEDVFHDDKFDSYLCYNKLPNDITTRCYNAYNLAKPWHTKYLKKKLDIFDSKIPGEIFDFESDFFTVKFTNLLRDYFSGEVEKRICERYNESLKKIESLKKYIDVSKN